jgi:hypothetical protein
MAIRSSDRASSSGLIELLPIDFSGFQHDQRLRIEGIAVKSAHASLLEIWNRPHVRRSESLLQTWPSLWRGA